MGNMTSITRNLALHLEDDSYVGVVNYRQKTKVARSDVTYVTFP